MSGPSRVSRWFIAVFGCVLGGCAVSPPTQTRVEALIRRPDRVQRLLTGIIPELDCASFRQRSDWLDPAIAAGWLRFRCEADRPVVTLTGAGRDVATAWQSRTWPDGTTGYDVTLARWVFVGMTVDQHRNQATVRYQGVFERTEYGEVFGLPARREVSDRIELRYVDGAWSPAAKGGGYIFH